MKILFITSDIPYPLDNGGRIRVFSLIHHMSLRHEVDVITFDLWGEPDRAESLRKTCQEIILIPLEAQQLSENKRKQQLLSLFRKMPYQYTAHYTEAMQTAIDRQLQKHDYDVIQIEFAQMGYYQFPNYANVVLDQHNVEAEIYYRTYKAENSLIRKFYNYAEWKKFKQHEIEFCRKIPTCLTTSVRDKEMLTAEAPQTSYHVIPNGVDSDFFTRSTDFPTAENTLMFMGTIDYYPNTDGLLYFLKEIFPLIQAEVPDVMFYIVGRSPTGEILAYDNHPNITVTGRVEDVREYYEKSTISVVPLRVGGGTRLKILEGLSMRTPIVSTPVGAEGIDVTHGHDIMIAEQPQAFADAVIQLLHNRQKRNQLAANGRALVEAKYDWYSISDQLEEVYHQMISSRLIAAT